VQPHRHTDVELISGDKQLHKEAGKAHFQRVRQQMVHMGEEEGDFAFAVGALLGARGTDTVCGAPG
jgi:hypothetical protein